MKKIAATFIIYFFTEIFISMIVLIALNEVYINNIQDKLLLPEAIDGGIILFISQLITLIVFFVVIINVFFDKNPFRNIIKFRLFSFLKGFFIGTSILLIMSLLFIGLDIQSYHINNINTNYLVKGLLLTVLIGIKEEVIFRGFLLVSLEDRYGKFKAIVVSSILFGLVHAFTDDFNLFILIEIFVGGIILCLAFYMYNNLWFPIGIHTAWNYFLFFIYSVEDKNVTEPFIIGKGLINPSMISLYEIAFLSGLLILFYRINRTAINSENKIRLT